MSLSSGESRKVSFSIKPNLINEQSLSDRSSEFSDNWNELSLPDDETIPEDASEMNKLQSEMYDVSISEISSEQSSEESFDNSWKGVPIKVTNGVNTGNDLPAWKKEIFKRKKTKQLQIASANFGCEPEWKRGLLQKKSELQRFHEEKELKKAIVTPDWKKNLLDLKKEKSKSATPPWKKELMLKKNSNSSVPPWKQELLERNSNKKKIELKF